LVEFQPRTEAKLFSDLRGQPLDERAAIEWDDFFPVGSLNHLQRAAKINTKVCRPLFEMPGVSASSRHRSLPYTTLAAGAQASA
jgi:hypothetical protein